MSVSRMHKEALLKQLPPLPSKPSDPTLRLGDKSRGIPRRDYTPLQWNEFYDQKQQIRIDDRNVFNVYLKGNTGPVLMLLHGGGFSGLTWACFAKQIVSLIDCRVAALDLRGHGDTITDDEYNLSAATQAKDIGRVFSELYDAESPPVFLMGHSMGGALAVHVASENLIPTLIGLAVIDVVEGSAMEALQSMQNFLRGRPDKFKSQEQAIEWCVRSGQVRNLISARVSMPGQIQRSNTNGPVPEKAGALAEEPEQEAEDEGSHATSPSEGAVSSGDHRGSNECYTWRIDLARTEPFWEGWFKGLSSQFLNIPVPKLLLLAGVDRLDKDLTVGQMRGQFQMMVLPKVGHAVHEDSPDRVADAVATFMIRNKFTVAISDNIHQEFPCC